MERNCTAVCWTVSRKHTRQRDTLGCTEVQQVHNCIVHDVLSYTHCTIQYIYAFSASIFYPVP